MEQAARKRLQDSSLHEHEVFVRHCLAGSLFTSRFLHLAAQKLTIERLQNKKRQGCLSACVSPRNYKCKGHSCTMTSPAFGNIACC